MYREWLQAETERHGSWGWVLPSPFPKVTWSWSYGFPHNDSPVTKIWYRTRWGLLR